MPTILVYNNVTNRMERGTYGLSSPMPYANQTLTVREFRGRSTSDLLWTDRTTMNTWVRFRNYYGRPIYVGYAFRRIGEGGHSNQSQHYAGVCFDVGQNLSGTARRQLYNAAVSSRMWSFVEPISQTPTWVHFDKRAGPPACAAGYPLVRQGSRGVYVCVLQDALQVVGHSGGNIDGVFGANTGNGVRGFQRANGLAVDGIVGCRTWTSLTAQANNAWRRGREIPEQYADE